MKVTKPKKNYQAEEIGKLRAAVAHREKSIAHYRALVEKHSKALHRQAKEIRRLRRELAAKNVVIEADRVMEFCCAQFIAATMPGTDNEAFGALFQLRVGGGQWRIGSELAEPKFCLWCGKQIPVPICDHPIGERSRGTAGEFCGVCHVRVGT
jgi:hypothetical protein